MSGRIEMGSIFNDNNNYGAGGGVGYREHGGRSTRRTDSFNSSDYLLKGYGDEEDGRSCASSLKRKFLHNLLLKLTILGVIVGIGVGYLLAEHHPGETWMEVIGFPGELFIRCLKCLIVPMISCALIESVAKLGSARGTSLATKAICWYLTTTLIACTSGVGWVYLFRPWKNFTEESSSSSSGTSSSEMDPRSSLESILELLEHIFPDNIFKAALELNMLGIITFSAVLGAVISTMEERGEALLSFFSSMSLAIQKMVGLVITVSPIGVCSLIAFHMGNSGDFWGVIETMGMLIATRLVGIVVHGLFTLPLLYFIVTRRNPYYILHQMMQAWSVAFATSSSAATLPVTIRCVEDNLGIAPPIARFVCTTGANVNMDAGAIAYTITAICMCKILDMPLTLGDIIMAVLSSTLVSVGAAALPSAGLVNYMAVMSAIGIPLDKAVPILAPILSVDWFEDRLMTIVNIEGDVFGAAAIQHYEPKDE